MAHKRRKTKTKHPSGRPEHEQEHRQQVREGLSHGSKAVQPIVRLPGHGKRS